MYKTRSMEDEILKIMAAEIAGGERDERGEGEDEQVVGREKEGMRERIRC